MDEEMLRYLAAKTGLSRNYIAKEEKISYLLSQLWEIFGEKAILKGGTALNRVYLARIGAARFSEDIDIDYFDGDLSTAAEEIKEGMELIEGFDVKGPRVLHRTFRFDCYYMNPLGNRDRVKVEFYLSRPPYIGARVELVKSPFVGEYPTMFRVYSFEDLLAKKLAALYNRTEGKDIYDSFHALNIEFDKNKLENALKLTLEFYHINTGDFLKSLVEKLDYAKKNARYLGNSTNHFIPKSLRPNWVEIIESLKLRIEELSQVFSS
ncbi:nucleotidyl transferase AbiEii/AbiGii toxin family protein [Thermococcus stetteri]|uniref:nucleotidyl transferase AbiEii/AbiGii toxin family protein n=1 Tax=Thermococcus stetteri TaxID=49900 RepID=UPI001AE5A40A|nr:nucleotidyl transferase AbiEii/AbiGii toxin family protein [Thermococcus stetteri]MBP1912383.1 putative nucleotidyltransferase component of viral defense system [Thermococcus stetteri]